LKSYSKLYSHLTTEYDKLARKGFLKTLKPKSFFEKTLSSIILSVTHLWYRIEEYIGFNNVLYLLLCYLVMKIFNYPFLFIILTSFVHYIKYIATFSYKKNINFGNFKRDCFLYKSIALINIIVILKNYFNGNFDKFPLYLIIFGYLLTMYSSYKLGIDHTYFGYELGKVEGKIVNDFPYNVLPHPMILGQLIAFSGMLLIKGIKSKYKYLIVTHIIFYVIHMLQEEMQIQTGV